MTALSTISNPTQLSSLRYHLSSEYARIAIVASHLHGSPQLFLVYFRAFDFVVAQKPFVSYPHLQPACRLLRKLLKERKTQETPAEEEVAGVEDVEEALVEVQLWTAQLLRETVEKAEVVEDGDEAGAVVAEGVEEETELSRKDKDQQTYNRHHNLVAQASLVVA